tara:strand:+ start:395 stop:637 length:243 start_codon:yes stop_codon:yes gene_type:complete
MARFTLTAIDEYSVGYTWWEGETLEDAHDELTRLECRMEETRHPSHELEAAINSLRDQIWEAEGVTDTVDKIADVLFPGG